MTGIPQTTPPAGLRARALAEHEADVERQVRQEREREFKRKEAHVELLRNLCEDILRLPLPPFIRWCSVKGIHGHIPATEIDGLLFTADENNGSLQLITFYRRGFHHNGQTRWYYDYVLQTVRTLLGLGKLLSDQHLLLGHLTGDTISPLPPAEGAQEAA